MPFDASAVLIGRTFRVAAIDGTPTLASPVADLEFGTDGRVTGSATVNRLFGPYAIDGGTLTTYGAPFNRILWSVQAGIVIAAGGLGLWFAKNGVIDEVGQPMQVLAILAMALGIGFVVSAFASYALSRQLGLVQPQAPHA